MILTLFGSEKMMLFTIELDILLVRKVALQSFFPIIMQKS